MTHLLCVLFFFTLLVGSYATVLSPSKARFVGFVETLSSQKDLLKIGLIDDQLKFRLLWSTSTSSITDGPYLFEYGFRGFKSRGGPIWSNRTLIVTFSCSSSPFGFGYSFTSSHIQSRNYNFNDPVIVKFGQGKGYSGSQWRPLGHLREAKSNFHFAVGLSNNGLLSSYGIADNLMLYSQRSSIFNFNDDWRPDLRAITVGHLSGVDFAAGMFYNQSDVTQRVYRVLEPPHYQPLAVNSSVDFEMATAGLGRGLESTLVGVAGNTVYVMSNVYAPAQMTPLYAFARASSARVEAMCWDLLALRDQGSITLVAFNATTGQTTSKVLGGVASNRLSLFCR